MSYTKGKWYIERTSLEDGNFQGRVLCESSEIQDPKGNPQIYIIVGEPSKKNGVANIHKEADAKLIAAAPDMLEALTELTNWVCALTDWAGGTTLDPNIEKAKEAIKKATE